MVDTATPTGDVYGRITDAIIAALEAGTRPWLRPWDANTPSGDIRPLRANGEAYRGVNVLVLWATAATKGYSNPYWMTFKQAQEFKGNVKKGEKGAFICYSSSFKKNETQDDGSEKERNIPFLKGYTVFNVEQCENLPPRFTKTQPKAERPISQRIVEVDEFVSATGVNLRHGGNRAFYSPGADFVQMPKFEDFKNPEGYAATLLHEMTHWTGHESRLARGFGARFGNETYAFEELIAEIGAAFTCATLGVASEIMPNHAAYLASWLRVLKDDKKAIFTAASAAQKAADFLAGFSNDEKEEC